MEGGVVTMAVSSAEPKNTSWEISLFLTLSKVFPISRVDNEAITPNCDAPIGGPPLYPKNWGY